MQKPIVGKSKIKDKKINKVGESRRERNKSWRVGICD